MRDGVSSAGDPVHPLPGGRKVRIVCRGRGRHPRAFIDQYETVEGRAFPVAKRGSVRVARSGTVALPTGLTWQCPRCPARVQLTTRRAYAELLFALVRGAREIEVSTFGD